jgi:hypothetical protein
MMKWSHKDSPPPKKGEDYTFCSQSYDQHVLGHSWYLILQSSDKQQTINAAYYVKLLND